MNILGLSAFYHDSSCCLLQDGELSAAASEERFTRIKHDSRLPVDAFRFCLDQAGLQPGDLDCIAYYENPLKKKSRQLAYANPSQERSDLSWIDPQVPLRLVREKLGFNGPVMCFDHHQSHAASAFYYSGFSESAILTVDGVGEWSTTTYGTGEGDTIRLFESVDFPHSIGLLYATITAFLGFRVNSGEYKVMGLAPYGIPAYLPQLRKLLKIGANGQYRLNMAYFDYTKGEAMYSQRLVELLEMPPRQPESEIKAEHKNLARSIQLLTEEILLEKVSYLRERSGLENLALAGGVGLNAVANRRIRREGGYTNIFIQPAAGDSGACLGAAALAHVELVGKRHSTEALSSLYLGPGYSSLEISHTLEAAAVQAIDYSQYEDELIQAVIDRLMDDKIIGWFQGRMEFGPRALGARSILANPMNPEMRERINRTIKKRETFRPFAPVILFSHLADHFDISHHTPFMIETCQVTSGLDLPAVTHVDGSARPQTLVRDEHPRFGKLLEEFHRRTGCPILVNTSFNQRGEPIVCTPLDALMCMASSDLDVLVIGDYIVDREQLPENWGMLLESRGTARDRSGSESTNPIQENLYSFT